MLATIVFILGLILRLIFSFLGGQNPVDLWANSSKNQECVWTFGYGSNMDVSHLRIKKNITVIEYRRAVLPGYRLAFTMKAMKYVEPAYSAVISDPFSEVHGIASCIPKKDKERLDRAERYYEKKMLTLEPYDGPEIIQAQVYLDPKESQNLPLKEYPPSRRYLNILIRGAKSAGLKESYIRKLEAVQSYQPSANVLRLRGQLPKPTDLRLITAAEVRTHDTWVSCLGYIIQVEPFPRWFSMHRGRDITSRSLMHFNDIPLDINDDGGKPPYPLVSTLTSNELGHIRNWCDMYLILEDETGLRPVVGYLKEFKKQQDSGRTTFVLPARKHWKN